MEPVGEEGETRRDEGAQQTGDEQGAHAPGGQLEEGGDAGEANASSPAGAQGADRSGDGAGLDQDGQEGGSGGAGAASAACGVSGGGEASPPSQGSRTVVPAATPSPRELKQAAVLHETLKGAKCLQAEYPDLSPSSISRALSYNGRLVVATNALPPCLSLRVACAPVGLH